jgi:nicotinate phosphoribosyltransferase
LEQLQFTDDDIRWLQTTGRFDDDFLDYLRMLRFSGDVDAMPEGAVFFAQEPAIRITAPLCEGQFIETRLINILQFQTLVATKAARCVIASGGKPLVDFGLRRAHGAEAGRLAARASYLAGFAATSNVLAAQQFGLPVSGTMAHSYVLAHRDELEAFERFAEANPADIVLLLDTYDSEAAAAKVVELAERLRERSLRIDAVRIDSGNLAEEARTVRRILDDGGCRRTQIFASGGLDEYEVERLIKCSAPIDGFGVGTALVTSADAPFLECAYKLQQYEGRPVRKRSQAKATWPGAKQVFRTYGRHGFYVRDRIALETERSSGEPLLIAVMRSGQRVIAAEGLGQIRERVHHELTRLPAYVRELVPNRKYPVEIADSVRERGRLADERVECRVLT